MADCHDLFEKFYGNVALSDGKKNNLKKARKALRDRIRNHFKEKRKEKAPFFSGQGSFSMDTIVNPINGEYDIDDGVYLQNLDPDMSKWPSSETVHNWIYEAVDSHTDQKPQDKRTCIRVLYSREKGQDYHVDLPIYGMKDKIAYLAEKGKSSWPESDPKAFIEWFEGNIKTKGELLRRMVCYLKAWSDHNQKQAPMLNGISLTIAAAEQLVSSQRDDQALVETVKRISSQIRNTKTIKKPVKPNENLLADWGQENITKLCDRLDIFANKGEKALNTDDKEEASLLWVAQFGNRFPKYEPPDDEDENSAPPKTTVPWKEKGVSVLGGSPKG